MENFSEEKDVRVATKEEAEVKERETSEGNGPITNEENGGSSGAGGGPDQSTNGT